jgi:hypothetical protein
MNPHVSSCPAYLNSCANCTCGHRERVARDAEVVKGPQPFRQAKFRSVEDDSLAMAASIVETRTTVEKVLSGPLTLEKLRALVKETEDWPDGLVLTRSKEVRTGPTTYMISKSV